MIDAKWIEAQEGGDHLTHLFNRPMTPYEVATRKDGLWSAVTNNDRIWLLTREGVMTPAQRMAWLLRLARRTPSLSIPGCAGFPCSAYANGCSNIAYVKAPAGKGADASERETQLQIEDAMLAIPMDDDRYD